VLKIIDLAAGGGFASAGVLRGLREHGLHARVVLAVDPWEPAERVYRANHPGVPFFRGRAEDLDPARLPEADLILSGPPCQGDSTLNRCRVERDRPDRRPELAGVKRAVATLRAHAPVVVMETVGKFWTTWGREQGASVWPLQDAAWGGFTCRRRTVLIWGARPIEPRAARCRGWGEALPQWAGVEGIVLANDADVEVKRRKHGGIPPWQPGYAVVGHGTAHRLYIRPRGHQTGPVGPEGWKYVHRLTPAEGAALQGFPDYDLAGLPVRVAQTVVGNGWPSSYGRAVAAALG